MEGALREIRNFETGGRIRLDYGLFGSLLQGGGAGGGCPAPGFGLGSRLGGGVGKGKQAGLGWGGRMERY